MAKINLRDYYPFYKYECFIEVPDKVAEALQDFDRLEATYQRRRYRNRAYYSLDHNDGIENDILFASLSASEIYERKVTYEQLYTAIVSLPDKQAKRIYAHYFLGMSNVAIAKAEGVSEKAVRTTIAKGLKCLEEILRNVL